jgi:hypothetical protein
LAIQLFVPRFHIDECLEQIRECLEKGWTGMGFKRFSAAVSDGRRKTRSSRRR